MNCRDPPRIRSWMDRAAPSPIPEPMQVSCPHAHECPGCPLIELASTIGAFDTSQIKDNARIGFGGTSQLTTLKPGPMAGKKIG